MKFLNLRYLRILKKINIHFFGLIFLILNLPLLMFSYFYPNIFKRSGVFFGGIPFKTGGGPTQKIKLLINHLGEKLFNFKCIYIISGSLRIPLYLLKVYKFLKVKIMINQNGVFYPSWYKGQDIVSRNKELHDYNAISNLTLFQSDFAKRSYLKFVGKIPKNYNVLYNAVDTNSFYPIKKITSKTDKVTILVAGNFYSFTEDYRVLNAIEAVKIVKNENYNVQLMIAGNLRKDMIIKINNQDLDFVNYVGGYESFMANKIFNSADVYLHLHYMGCCDNILLEMMACGLKIIALNNGGNKELLPEKYVTLIPSRNNWYKQNNPHPIVIAEYLKTLLHEDRKNNNDIVNHVRQNFSLQRWISFHKLIIDKF